MAEKAGDALEKYALIKALKTVLREPNKKFSVRGLAAAAGLSASAAKTSVDFLRRSGVVSLEKVGRTFQFKADLSSALARQWKILFSLEEIERVGLVKKIFDSCGGVSSVLLYGSTAAGTSDAASDLDLLVVANSKKKSFAGLAGVEAELGREINLLVKTPFEWRETAKQNKVFYERVILDSIVLYGSKPVVF
jgi:predicted nucleotidyltransferase